MSNEESSQFNVQGYNIVTILKRLEAATSRLEDISVHQNSLQNPHEVPGTVTVTPASKSIDQSPAAAAGGASKSVAGAPEEQLPPAVAKFEQFVQDVVDPWVKQSNLIDPQVAECATLLLDAFVSEVGLLKLATRTAKPDPSDPALVQALSPVNERVTSIGDIKDKNRPSPFFNHLSTIAEGAPVLGWVMSETPASWVDDFRDSASFYSNRVLKESKDRDDAKAHQEWVASFSRIFDELRAYVKEYQTTGIQWNPQGTSLAESLKTYGVPTPSATPHHSMSAPSGAPKAASAAASGGAAPPPPPPPPPADLFDAESKPEGGMSAVFDDLNRGEDITKGLKKVDKSQMTHKNPELRNKKPLPPKKPAKFGTKPPSPPAAAVATGPKQKPAKVELIDTKWLVEGQYKADQPIVINAEKQQSIFIGHCADVTIQIKGKANAISVSETKNVAIVVDSLISGVDIIKSDKFALQVLEVVPTIYIDKCDQGTLYISQASIDSDIKIYSTCSTSVNINVPEQDDYVELAVPEQFEHQIKNGKLVTSVVEHKG
ncbi:hypothetical protein DIURU_000743 [Diutina rugosa]|uniref:Adenylyl cyclase-associated protein n=1 Tax=Diutina rugosa TaxID=5481 RepID=A0A642UX21_DIURU|nr:uncharacterized protein DIURU_000743 [Diutina rugosa]KAA8907059.1 hypothetical protein DIURU_000743 [Diutina rugosa]